MPRLHATGRPRSLAGARAGADAIGSFHVTSKHRRTRKATAVAALTRRPQRSSCNADARLLLVRQATLSPTGRARARSGFAPTAAASGRFGSLAIAIRPLLLDRCEHSVPRPWFGEGGVPASSWRCSRQRESRAWRQVASAAGSRCMGAVVCAVARLAVGADVGGWRAALLKRSELSAPIASSIR
jgi:hypothetical protein